MLPLFNKSQAGVIEAFNSTVRYIDDFLNKWLVRYSQLNFIQCNYVLWCSG